MGEPNRMAKAKENEKEKKMSLLVSNSIDNAALIFQVHYLKCSFFSLFSMLFYALDFYFLFYLL